VGGEALDDLDGLGVFLAEPGVLVRLAEDGRIGQSALDLARPLFDVAELVKQHRDSMLPSSGARRWGWAVRAAGHGGAGPPPAEARPWTKKRPAGARSRRPRSACYEVASGWRLYFFWNRSTRPAVSMSLCLPV